MDKASKPFAPDISRKVPFDFSFAFQPIVDARSREIISF